jgi:hypothetical protein
MLVDGSEVLVGMDCVCIDHVCIDCVYVLCMDCVPQSPNGIRYDMCVTKAYRKNYISTLLQISYAWKITGEFVRTL